MDRWLDSGETPHQVEIKVQCTRVNTISWVWLCVRLYLLSYSVRKLKMAEIDDFITAPSQELLDLFTKEQLLIVAEHFSVVIVGDKRLKENIKAAIKTKLRSHF